MALFKGNFNISGQVIIVYTHANKKEHAYLNFMNQLCKKLDLTNTRAVMRIFNGSKDNYFIEKVYK